MENAQAEMRPYMDGVIRDVGDGRNSLTSPDGSGKTSVFNDSDNGSRELQKLLDAMSYVPERLARYEDGKFVAQRNGFISYIYTAKKT